MEDQQMRPYALKAGAGSTYRYGIDFTVKAGELRAWPRLAFIEYTTRAGEEPPDHTDAIEDEIFYAPKREIVLRRGEKTYGLAERAFIFLPSGLDRGCR